MGKIVMFFLFVLLAATVSAQNVSNVDFHQVGDEIVITYDLDERAPTGVYVSLDGGKSYEEVHSVRGDVGHVVLPGKKRILWKVLYDIPEGLAGPIQFKVSANLFVSISDIEFEMVYVKGGTFMMGELKECTLSDYYIGKYEVTQRIWQTVMGSNPSRFKQGVNYPVENVSWDDIQDFLTKLNQLTGRRYTLPTEAQWEYAARGGVKSHGYKYSGSDNIDEVAWYGENYNTGSTHPVGSKKPNELGIYDMCGNVYEWCQDSCGSYCDPPDFSPGIYHLLRNGNKAGIFRVEAKNRGFGDNYFGFRLGLVP